MIKRIRLENYLRELYEYKNFEDYCYNGMQIEGSEEIRKIALGVSLNNNLIDSVIKSGFNALIVHHGFFGKEFTSIQRRKKTLIEKLIKNDISLFGIHLPMDAHKEIGHNRLLFDTIDAEIKMDFEVGFIGKNITNLSLVEMLHKFSDFLNSEKNPKIKSNSPFNVYSEFGFTIVPNGPKVPNRIAIISGGGSGDYEKALSFGVDTFFCGEIKEEIPSISFDTKTNFINLTHYNSEKPGLIKLMEKLQEDLEITAQFIDIPNPI